MLPMFTRLQLETSCKFLFDVSGVTLCIYPHRAKFFQMKALLDKNLKLYELFSETKDN